MTPTVATLASPRVGAGFVTRYGLAFFGLWMALLTPPVVTLALRVAELAPADKETQLAWLTGIGALVAMVANPIAGHLSDRTSSRWGMRRPWMLGGVLLGLAGLVLMTLGGLRELMLGWCLAQLGFNATLAAITALLPDQVPEEQRGAVSGVLGICVQLGVVAGVAATQAVGGRGPLLFVAPGLVALVLVLLLCAGLDDRRLAPGSVTTPLGRSLREGFRLDLRAAPDFGWAFASRFLLFLGLATLLTYQVFFLTDRLGLPREQVPGAMLQSTLVTTATTVLASVASGWLSDRLRRRKVFVLLSAALYGAGLLLVGMAGSFTVFLWGIALCGVAQGVYLAVDLALVTLVLPHDGRDAAKDLGIFNLASALPQTVAPALAPLLLGLGGQGPANYTVLFGSAAAFAVVGAMAVVPIRRVT